MSVHVHQFHPTVAFGDAIGNHILSVRRLLRGLGYRSRIFCEHLPVHFEGRARHLDRYARHSSPSNVLLLHFSIGYSPAVLRWIEQLPDRKVLVYHNITPHAYFAGINEAYYEAARAGREQLETLSGLTEAAWGVSTFNRQELREIGWERTAVLPIIFDPRRYTVRPDRKVLKRGTEGFNLLFVGRVSPNKKLEDVILTFYHLKRYVCPDARLFLVGSARGMEPYLEFLQTLVTRLELEDVVFTGHVSNSQLVAHYRCASVYLSMSEHEGFGVPLLESTYFGVPVVAYAAAAVPETLDGSGILVKEKDHVAVAELIGLLAEDDAWRRRVVARQRERLRDFLPGRVKGRLIRLLDDLEGPTG